MGDVVPFPKRLRKVVLDMSKPLFVEDVWGGFRWQPAERPASGWAPSIVTLPEYVEAQGALTEFYRSRLDET